MSSTHQHTLKQHIMEGNQPETSYVNLKQKVSLQLNSVIECQKVCQDIQAKQDSFIRDYEKLQEHFSEDLGNYLHDKYKEILKDREQLTSQCKAMVVQCEGQQMEIASVIAEWQRLQQRRLIGEKLPSLDTLQTVCEDFAEVLQQGKVLVDAVLRMKQYCEFKETVDTESGDGADISQLENLSEKLEETLMQLLGKSLIMDEQPPSVLHVEKGDSKKFCLSIRWLVGNKFSLALEQGKVKAEFHNVASLQSSKTSGRHGKLDSKVLKGNFGVKFENMQVKGFSRLPTNIRDSEKAAEQRHFVVITGQLLLPDRRPLQLQVLSQPMFLTAQSQQNPDAQAKAIWCMLGNKGHEVVNPKMSSPDKVAWSELAKVLSQLFKHGTGRGLAVKHMDYLAGRIFGQTKDLGSDFSGLPVTWDQFNRKPLSGTKFTFWRWFFATLNLTKEFLVDQWKKGLIEGFIDKDRAESLLKGLPRTSSGTFLLRFTNRYVDGNQKANPCGGLSVVYAEWMQNKMEVNHAAAITASDLKETNLPIFLSQIQFITENSDPNAPNSTKILKYLYPNVSFRTAFGEWLPARGNGGAQKKNAQDKHGYLALKGVKQVHIPTSNQAASSQAEPDTSCSMTEHVESSHNGQKRFARGSADDLPKSTPVVAVDSMSSGILLFERNSLSSKEQVTTKFEKASLEQEPCERSPSDSPMLPVTTTMYTASPGYPDTPHSNSSVGSPQSQPGGSPRSSHDDTANFLPGSQSSISSYGSPSSQPEGSPEGSVHDTVTVLAPGSNSSGYSSYKSPGSSCHMMSPGSSATGSPSHNAGSPLGQEDVSSPCLSSQSSGSSDYPASGSPGRTQAHAPPGYFMTSTGMAPSGIAPSGMAPSRIAPSGMAPSGMAPSGMATSGMAPSGMAPSGMAPSQMAPSGMAPSGMAPSGMAPSQMAPSGMAPSHQKAFSVPPFTSAPTGVSNIQAPLLTPFTSASIGVSNIQAPLLTPFTTGSSGGAGIQVPPSLSPAFLNRSSSSVSSTQFSTSASIYGGQAQGIITTSAPGNIAPSAATNIPQLPYLLKNVKIDGARGLSQCSGAEEGVAEDMNMLDKDTLEQIIKALEKEPGYKEMMKDSDNLNL